MRLVSAARDGGLKTLVTTMKDYVKWQPLLAGQQREWPVDVVALEGQIEIVEGKDILCHQIRSLLPAFAGQGPASAGRRPA